jgi:1-hydroxycarotenoid 3,4-desaturase
MPSQGSAPLASARAAAPRAAGTARRLVVVGAGVGGLAAAIRLARTGVTVRLIEAAEGPGGKMRALQVGGAPIDTGPTVFTMRWVFEELFDAAGEHFERCVSSEPLQVLARHAWRDGSQLDLYADPARTTEAIASFAGGAEARRFQAFCEQARRVLQTLEPTYIRAPRPSFAGMVRDLGPGGLAMLASLGPFSSLAANLHRRFADPRLRQLFARYATYCGASPWQAPATLMLIAQVEMNGVWRIRGGMNALAQALADLAQRCGVQIDYGRPARRILVRQGAVCGIELADGERLGADAVVFAGDVNALASGLLGESVQGSVRPVATAARSLSAITWAIRGEPRGFPLVHHNVFFDEDYASEFRDIVQHQRLPQRATVYVCAQDRGDPGTQPCAAERLLCLVNAPALGDRQQPTESEIDQCQVRSFELLRHCGLALTPDSANTLRSTPASFEQRFPATGGALYGMAMNGWLALFRRAPATTGLAGLFLAGGSAHPGAGVPMAAISGRWAAEAATAYLASISRYHPGATFGGTSTPSATTVSTG